MIGLENLIKKLKKLKDEFGKIGFWAAFSLLMPIIGLTVFIGVIFNVSPWLQKNKVEGVFAFVIAVSVLAGLAILPTNVVGMVSGWAFNFQLGLLAMLGAIGGALAINYFVSKRLAGENFQNVIEEKPKLNAVHKALLKESFSKTLLIIVLLRLSPAVPFAATNFMISASGVSMKTFLLGTLIGYLPRTSATVFVGSSLTTLNFNQPQESWMIILGIIATLVATIVIGIFSKRALNQMTMEHAQ
jgi:uncharacterized membrane protein YdjX (TVP38/TMEM64 family)